MDLMVPLSMNEKVHHVDWIFLESYPCAIVIREKNIALRTYTVRFGDKIAELFDQFPGQHASLRNPQAH